MRAWNVTDRCDSITVGGPSWEGDRIGIEFGLEDCDETLLIDVKWAQALRHLLNLALQNCGDEWTEQE